MCVCVCVDHDRNLYCLSLIMEICKVTVSVGGSEELYHCINSALNTEIATCSHDKHPCHQKTESNQPFKSTDRQVFKDLSPHHVIR